MKKLSRLQECIESLKSHVDTLYERRRLREEMRLFMGRQIRRRVADVAEVPLEHSECVSFMDWLELAKPPGWEWVYHVPNGGKRDIVTAKKLQAEGQKTGVPDYCYPRPAQGWPGLYIEMKRTKGGSLKQSQREYIDYLRSVGYAVVVAKGWQEAAAAVEKYFAGQLRRE